MIARQQEEKYALIDGIVKQVVQNQIVFNKKSLQERIRLQNELDEISFINRLRHLLLNILMAEYTSQTPYPVAVYDHIYFSLLYLAKHWPLNNKNNEGHPVDCFSLKKIEPQNLFLTSTGFQIDVKFNREWIHNNQKNPATQQAFNSRDINQFHSLIPLPGIQWREHLPIAGVGMLAGGGLGISAVLITPVIYTAAILALGSNPVGWMILGAVAGAAVGIAAGFLFSGLFSDLITRYKHYKAGIEPQCKVTEIDHAADVPLHSLKHNPALSQFYKKQGSVNDMKKAQVEPIFIPTLDLRQDPSLQLESIKDVLVEEIKIFANEREICDDFKWLKGEVDHLSYSHINESQIKINISRLITKLEKIERNDLSLQKNSAKYDHHHACANFLRQVKDNISKLKQYVSAPSQRKPPTIEIRSLRI